MTRIHTQVASMGLSLACSMALAGEITVSAAASLSNAFKEVAQGFEAQHPGSKVLLNFAASGALLQQLAKGAPVDVLASADQETLDQAAKQGLIQPASRRDFARNTLVLVVPAASKLAPKSLAELARPAYGKVAIGNPASVPVGRYARSALAAARLWPAVSAKAVNTLNVRQSLDYVARGEVDAGFVYATDARLMADKVKVAFAVPLGEAIRYPIASTTAAANPRQAKSFIDYVLSPAGQAILARYGFQKP
jgi:molybdate transport system substrate-binding protein